MDFEQRPGFWIEKMESFLVYTLVSNVNYEREEAKRHRDSHEDMLDDCICGFGVMLYLALKSSNISSCESRCRFASSRS
jgi:hypothetical protein